MIKVWLIVVACLEPDYTLCARYPAIEQPNMRVCQLNRSAAASTYQTFGYDGWLTFTKCQYVNPDKNGSLG